MAAALPDSQTPKGRTVYATCGLSFSGKSTAARTLARRIGADLIALDAINHERGLRGGEGIPDSEWEKTSAIAMARLAGSLRAGRDGVVDDTFSHRFLRERCRKVAAEGGARFVLLFLDTPLDTIAARRAANAVAPVRHAVRDEVFEHHRARFEFPGPDEDPVRLTTPAEFEAWLAGERADRTAR